MLNGYQQCLELGAGPLRVTLGLLSYYYKKIDINDIAKNLERVWKNLEPQFTNSNEDRRKRKAELGERYICNMTDITFDKKYNLIYGNWCLGYLTD